MYDTYILHSNEHDRYYVGSTSNIENRIALHNAGRVRSTKAFRPWVLAHQETFDTNTEARKRENQIKRFKRGDAFYKLIQK